MLRLLRIENLVLARDVQLEFGPGLNLITGETGAGKSLIGGAIGLALAGRGEAALVRQGEDRALVEAMFDISSRPDLQHRLSRAGYETPGGELLIRRELAADGRSKVLVNGQSITIAMLKELTAGLLEMHGQNEPHTLLSPETHRALLDRFGGTDNLLNDLRRVHTALRETLGRLNELAERAVQRGARVELLHFRLAEIDAIRPQPGEEEKLRIERDRLRHAEAIAESLQGSLDAVYEGEGAALEKVHAATRRLRAQASHDPQIGELADRLDDVRTALQDVAAEIRDHLDAMNSEPTALIELEERLVALERLRRRFEGAELNQIVAGVEALRRELTELEGQSGSEAELILQRDRLLSEYRAVSGHLTAARRDAAEKFGKTVSGLLAQLAMNQARLDVAVSPADVDTVAVTASGADGADLVEFLLAANPGEPARPLRKVASGGELSRVMLALDIALEGGLARRTLLFDEIDQGLGGNAADKLGEFLVRVALHHQVICITHLPQVAVRAETHLHVSKKLKAGRTVVVVKPLDDEDDRVEEVARMIGGSYVTETARRHAEAMLRADRSDASESTP